MPLETVNPGDLITSDDWNDLVNAFNQLEALVADLSSGGSSGPPVITLVLPGGTLTEGDTIQIFGRNFDFTKGGHGVFFGGTPAINFLTGSSDTKLIVQIPNNVNGATPTGAPVTMMVSNLVGFTSQSVTVKSKPVVVTGGFEFGYLGSNPITPTAGQSITFNFQLTSLANIDLIATITPVTIRSGAGPIVPNNQLEVLDEDGTVRNDRTIPLSEGESKIISIRIPTIPSSLPNGTQFTLQASVSAPGVQTVAETVSNLTIGQASEQPDPTITNFEFNNVLEGTATFTPSSDPNSGIDGTLSIPGGTTATIALDTTFANIPTGTEHIYDLAATVIPTTAGWSAVINSITTPNFYTIGSPGGQRFPAFDVTVPTSGGPVNMRFSVTRRGAATNNRRFVTYRVQRS